MENQSLLAYLQRSLAMVMNEVTLNQAPTSNSLFAGDSEFAISLLVDSIERVLQHGRKCASTLYPLGAAARSRFPIGNFLLFSIFFCLAAFALFVLCW
jgi:hypothetical protein